MAAMWVRSEKKRAENVDSGQLCAACVGSVVPFIVTM